MYEKELIELSKNKVKYLIVGAIGGLLSGYSRVTFDLDLFIDLKSRNLKKIDFVLKKLGYAPRVHEDLKKLADPRVREYWYKKKNMKVFSFLNPKDQIKTIDLMVYSPVNFNEAYKRRNTIKLNNTNVHVASIDDLILFKANSRRGKDLLDLKALKKLKEMIEDEKN